MIQVFVFEFHLYLKLFLKSMSPIMSRFWARYLLTGNGNRPVVVDIHIVHRIVGDTTIWIVSCHNEYFSIYDRNKTNRLWVLYGSRIIILVMSFTRCIIKTLIRHQIYVNAVNIIRVTRHKPFNVTSDWFECFFEKLNYRWGCRLGRRAVTLLTRGKCEIHQWKINTVRSFCRSILETS